MTIRDDAEAAFFKDRAPQRELALKFGEAFTVTYGRGHGELSYWLLDPKPQTRERFGFGREILAVFCPHSRVDQRSLRAAEELLKDKLVGDRFERGIMVLIHDADPAHVSALIGSQHDLTVIPFAQSELLNPNRGDIFIRSRLSEVLGSADLFAMSSPIKNDRHLFGRTDFVQRLIGHSVQNGQNAGLFGLRKTGKTSVLFALQRRLDASVASTAFIDCQNPGFHSMRWWDLLSYIAKRCAESAKIPIVEAKYTQESAGILFLEALKKIVEESTSKKVILLLDEIEYISSGMGSALGKHWKRDFSPFWQVIRATHQETAGAFIFIVAGVNPAAVEQSHFEGVPNPIFQLATPFYIEPLSPEAIRSMVRDTGKRGGIIFDEPVYAFLANNYGGHPYLIRTACSTVSQKADRTDPEKLARIDVHTFVGAAKAIRSRVERPIKDILLSLIWWYPDEYDILQIIATGDAKFVSDYMEQNPETILRFARYGLLREGSHDFAIQELREFLTRHGQQYKADVSKFASSDIPPDKLPNLPDISRIGRLAEKRAEIESNLRRATLTFLGVKFGWDNKRIARAIIKALGKRPDREQPEDSFLGRLPKEAIAGLYLGDLHDIVAGNWDIFAQLFDAEKQKFDGHMQTISEIRLDEAHSRPISDSDEGRFGNAYEWIMKCLRRIPADAA